jgi:FMN phosphatase YigB (HAD superfamily)
VAKPDPRIFRLACEALGVAPAELVFFDDIPGHVEAARQLGIQALLFTGNAAAISEIDARVGVSTVTSG